jgi:hypothetical protein
MRRLPLVAVVGTLLLPIGLATFINPGSIIEPADEEFVRRLVGLVVALFGAMFMFGGLVGATLKLVTDVTTMARTHGQ